MDRSTCGDDRRAARRRLRVRGAGSELRRRRRAAPSGPRVAYDEELAARVRAILGSRRDVGEQRMFGGLTFMVAGHMCCGVVGDALMVRLDETLANEALAEPHVRPMDFTGRPLKTMVYVDPPGLTGRALRTWVERAAAHAGTRPAKPG